MNKNRRIIGTPQNSSIEDEIRQIFDIYFDAKPKITKEGDSQYVQSYTIRLPIKHQFISYGITNNLAIFCRIHHCKWWAWANFADYKGMLIRIGHFQQPSPTL